jgi:hypothetical protein
MELGKPNTLFRGNVEREIGNGFYRVVGRGLDKKRRPVCNRWDRTLWFASKEG